MNWSKIKEGVIVILIAILFLVGIAVISIFVPRWFWF